MYEACGSWRERQKQNSGQARGRTLTVSASRAVNPSQQQRALQRQYVFVTRVCRLLLLRAGAATAASGPAVPIQRPPHSQRAPLQCLGRSPVRTCLRWPTAQDGRVYRATANAFFRALGARHAGAAGCAPTVDSPLDASDMLHFGVTSCVRLRLAVCSTSVAGAPHCVGQLARLRSQAADVIASANHSAFVNLCGQVWDALATKPCDHQWALPTRYRTPAIAAVLAWAAGNLLRLERGERGIGEHGIYCGAHGVGRPPSSSSSAAQRLC